MILKKKIEIAAIVCSIGLCSFGQNVCASEFMRLPKESNEKMEHLVQTRLLKEQRDYLLHAQLITKINLEKKILEKPVFIPGTSHQITTRERAVLERILNRVRSKEFPDSIEKVVFQRENGKVQFSPTADGRYDAVHVTKSSRESVKRALEGEDYSEGALYFVEKTMANPRNVSWFENNLTMLFTYEGHSFYK